MGISADGSSAGAEDVVESADAFAPHGFQVREGALRGVHRLDVAAHELLPAAPAEVILLSMTHRVGSKGQVVIPKELRDQMGIEAGDAVNFWIDGDHVALSRAAGRAALRGRFAGSMLSTLLEDDRTADRKRDRER